MKLEKQLKVASVATTLIFIICFALSFVAVEYQETAYDYYDQWYSTPAGSLSETHAWNNYVSNLDMSNNLLTIIGIMTWIVLIGLLFICFLVFLVCKGEKINRWK